MKEELKFRTLSFLGFPNYTINTDSFIINLNTGKFLKHHKNDNGYMNINLSLRGRAKTFKVHKIMAMAFLKHEPDGHSIVVDHIDNDKSNNKLDNLQLMTTRENASKTKRGSSKYTGVSLDKRNNKWKAWIRIGKQNKWLGSFKEEHDAHLAYEKALKAL